MLKKVNHNNGGLMMKETNVKCNVENCKHNECNCCNLDELDISCTCKGCDCTSKDETICKSFKEK